jgi:adenylate cyclase
MPIKRSSRRSSGVLRSERRRKSRPPEPVAITSVEFSNDAALLRTPLESIEARCLEILADCDGRPEEFLMRVMEIRAAAQAGLAIVDEQAVHFSTIPLPAAVIKRLGDDLPHKILSVYYKCDELLKRDAEWYGPFEEPLSSILKCYKDCRAAIQQLLTSQPAAEAVEAAESGSAIRNGEASASAEGALLHGPSVATGRILVVDDDSESRRRLEQLLRSLHHSVDSANNGRDALEHLEKHHCDLVVLDLCMDGVDGAAVLQEMRKDYALRTVPVIVVSAAQDVGSAIRCIELGADDFLTKPFDEALLRARVASCLDKGTIRRNDRALNDELLRAKARIDDLLYEVFPYTVAQELRTGGKVQPRGCENVAVLFCDLVGFTTFCSGKPAAIVVEILDRLFAEFEEAADRAGVEKIKTIGDCFMITAGVMGKFANPVESCLRCAQEMFRAADESDPRWDVRIGIHVGPVVAGMVGRKQFAFDVWGDTVNTASRIQSAAEPGMIALSEPAWAQVFQLCRGKSIGLKHLKGKSDMEVFRFDGFRATALPR